MEYVHPAAKNPHSESAKKHNQISASASSPTFQRVENNTGLPDNLKAGIENLSGYSMADVNVHYNSNKPADLQAHAYAQGTDIHLAPGQERHLPHEAWHVVQQKQGRVKPTMQLKAKVNVNDDSRLENEADVMGGKAMQKGPNLDKSMRTVQKKSIFQHHSLTMGDNPPVVQRVIGDSAKVGDVVITLTGNRWIITAVSTGFGGGVTYTVEQISGRPTMMSRRTVSSTDLLWNIEAQDEPESEGYLSEDIDSASEGEDIILKRPGSGTVIHTKVQTPKSAEKRSADHIRAMRGNGKKARKTGPFVTKFGDSHFEFHPTPFRKDYGVTPLVANKDGSLQRTGGARLYPDVANDLDNDIKRTGASTEDFNKCLEYILRTDGQASLEELKKICATLDEKSLENLREMAAILRLDQARASQGRSVIDEEVLGSKDTFGKRFGKPKSKTAPTYRGARAASRHKGLGGVQSLRQAEKEKYGPKKKDEKNKTSRSTTYEIDQLPDSQLIELINRAAEKNTRWALQVIAETNGDEDAAVDIIRKNHSRITLLPDGNVFIHLRGG